MMDITEKIAKLIDSGTPPKEIAVLYKEHKYGTEIAHFLQQKISLFIVEELLIYLIKY
jgi:hypothetical protein